MRDLLRAYRRSLPVDRRHLLEGYRYAHMARRVGGVGSVGTRTWIVLLIGRDGDDPLFLQVKQAGRRCSSGTPAAPRRATTGSASSRGSG